MQVGIDSPLSSISAFSSDLKRIQIPHRLYPGILEQIKALKSVGQAAEFTFEPCRSSGNLSESQIGKAITEGNQRI